MRRKSRFEFWSRVVVKSLNECWEWQGCKTKTGHGFLAAEGKHWYAHRVAYESLRGELPPWSPQQELMHACSNACCCNPLHLDVGTRSQNLFTAGALGLLSRKGENNGKAKLTKEQVKTIYQDTRSGTVIAKEYGLNSRSQVNRIRRGEHWCEK